MPENILTETGVLSRVLGMVGQPGGIAGLDNDGQLDSTLYQNIVMVTAEDIPTEDYGGLISIYKVINVTRNGEPIYDARSIQCGDYIMVGGCNFIITSTYINKALTEAFGIGTYPNAAYCRLSWNYSSVSLAIHSLVTLDNIIDLDTHKIATELLYNTYQAIDIIDGNDLPPSSEVSEIIVKLSGLNGAQTDSIQINDVIILYDIKIKILYTDNQFNGTSNYKMVGILVDAYDRVSYMPATVIFNPHDTDTWHLYTQILISSAEADIRFIPKNETGFLDASYFNHIDVHVKDDFKIYTDSSYQTLNSYQEIDVPSEHNLFSNITPGCILDISTNKFNEPISNIIATETHNTGAPSYAHGYCYIAAGNIIPGTKDISAGPYVTTIYNSAAGREQDSIYFEPLLTFSNFWNLKGPEISEHCVLRDEPQPVEFCTQAEYDASTAKRANTLYVITDASF